MPTVEQQIKESFPELRNHQHLFRSLIVFLTEANKIAEEITKTLDDGDILVIDITRCPKDAPLKTTNNE